MSLTREDVVRITEQVLSDLRLQEERPSFTDPNTRTVHLKYKGKVISTVYFDVKDRPEYNDY